MTHNDTAIYDANEILDIVESNLSGFVSLRASSYAAFQTLNNTGWDNIGDIPEVHWLSSLSLRSVLNSNREIIVGDKLIKFVNKDFGMTVDLTADIDIVSGMSGLTETSTFEDAYDILDMDFDGLVGITLMEGGTDYSIAKTSAWDKFHIGTPLIWFPSPCGTSKKVQLKDIRLNYVDLPSQTQCKADYIIDWGDGSALEYKTSNGGLNNSLLTAEHTYATNGTFTVHLKAKSISPESSSNQVAAEAYYAVEVGPKDCLYGFGRELHSPRHVSGDRGWSGKCYIWQNDYLLGQNRKIGAETHRYRQKDNGKWVEEKGPVAVSWVCEMRDVNCSSTGTNNRSSNPGNSKTASAEISLGSNKFGWHKITSTHSIDNGGVQWFSMELWACD